VKTRGYEKAVCLVKIRSMPMKNAKKNKNAKKSKINSHAKDHLKNKIKALQNMYCK